MKNRRRTRRGRAKRWIYNGFGCWFHIRRSGNATFVAASRGEWVLDDAIFDGVIAVVDPA